MVRRWITESLPINLMICQQEIDYDNAGRVGGRSQNDPTNRCIIQMHDIFSMDDRKSFLQEIDQRLDLLFLHENQKIDILRRPRL